MEFAYLILQLTGQKKLYPLASVTRLEVLDLFIFWAKSSVDVEPRRITLKSNSYTACYILDMVTAASIQVKEMDRTTKPPDSAKDAEQPAEKKKPFIDWINLMKPRNVPDEAVTKCTTCSSVFNSFNRRELWGCFVTSEHEVDSPSLLMQMLNQ